MHIEVPEMSNLAHFSTAGYNDRFPTCSNKIEFRYRYAYNTYRKCTSRNSYP